MSRLPIPYGVVIAFLKWKVGKKYATDYGYIKENINYFANNAFKQL